jgi:hypothetical protein
MIYPRRLRAAAVIILPLLLSTTVHDLQSLATTLATTFAVSDSATLATQIPVSDSAMVSSSTTSTFVWGKPVKAPDSPPVKAPDSPIFFDINSAGSPAADDLDDSDSPQEQATAQEEAAKSDVSAETTAAKSDVSPDTTQPQSQIGRIPSVLTDSQIDRHYRDFFDLLYPPNSPKAKKYDKKWHEGHLVGLAPKWALRNLERIL